VLIFAAAERTEVWDARSRVIKWTEMEGYWVCMAVMIGAHLEGERPVRMIADGRPAARVRAVSAPMPPIEGPVRRTGFVRWGWIRIWKGDNTDFSFYFVFESFDNLRAIG